MTWMWDSSVDFFLIVWVKGNDAKFSYLTKSKFLRLIYETLNEYNISIPFPQTDLHIKDSIPVNININNNNLLD
jgi:small-conductance mechanosensitive channel